MKLPRPRPRPRPRRWRPSRSGLARAGFLTGMALLFVVTSVQVADAAGITPTPAPSGGGTGGAGTAAPRGGMLGPFNVPSSEQVPLDHYDLVSDPGGLPHVEQMSQSYLMGMLFALARLIVGLECWLVHAAYTFPVTRMLAGKSQELADAYRTHVVDALGLPGMLLAWAVVVCAVMLLRGRTGRAMGEMALTFVIVAVASSALVRPDVILGAGGVIDQTRQASLEVAAITTDGGTPPPANVDPASISVPLERTLTDTFVVQPYQLLQFGRPIPKGDKAYDTYLAAVAANSPTTTPPDCSGLDGTMKTWCQTGASTPNCQGMDGATKLLCEQGAGQKTDCSGLVLLAKQLCEQGAPGTAPADKAKALADKFKDVDPTIAAYVAQPSWDRVFGALLLLVAVLVVLLMVIAMVLALFAAQFADAALACCAYPALIWASLPGPSRGVLWRWVGGFVTSALTLLAASVFLPAFGLACTAFLTGTGMDLITRLFLVDLIALLALGFHRRLMAGAATAGSRLANRLRWARVGGTGSGDDATRTGQIIAGALGSDGFSASAGAGMFGGAFAAGSPIQAHLARRGRLLASARALGDIPGAVIHPGRLIGDIGREAAHGMAPLTLAARGAHHAWKGRALTPEEFEDRRIKPGLGGGLPVGSRLHNQLIQTRGGRVLLGSSRLAWGASFGAPATWTRTRRRVAAARRDTRGQYEHYKLEFANYRDTEWKPGARDMATPARVAGHAAATAGMRMHVAADVYGPAAADAARRAATNTVTAGVLHAGPSPAEPGPVRARHTHARAASQEERARAEILHALRRAQREARGDGGGDL